MHFIFKEKPFSTQWSKCMIDFEKFRKNTNAARFNDAMVKANSKNKYDDGSWNIGLDRDDQPNSAVIRFLPPMEGDLPYEMVMNHFFKGDDGSWCIIDRCPRTWNETCPCCAANHELWELGDDASQEKARRRKARKTYLFNIYVVKEPLHPENEGKVFLYKCGPQVFNMIIESMSPEFGDEPKNPFDLYNGHNFEIRIRKDPKNGLPTYDRSRFADVATPICNSEAELREIFDHMIDLKAVANRGKLSSEAIMEKVVKAYSGKIAQTVASKNNISMGKAEVKYEEPSAPTDINDVWGTPSEKTSEPVSMPSASSSAAPWDNPVEPSEAASDPSNLDFFRSLAKS